MRNQASIVLSLGLILVSATTVSDGRAQEGDRVYPNELPGYQFHAGATWRALQPLASRDAEVSNALGALKSGGYTFGRGWRLTVHYWGAGGHCDGVPFPDFLVGTVANIELVPKGRVSFLGVQFPAAFRQVTEMGAHDPVGSWQLYRDEFGLEYRVYDQASSDGSVRVGDLKSIVYGPSRHTYVTLTGCSIGADE